MRFTPPAHAVSRFSALALRLGLAAACLLPLAACQTLRLGDQEFIKPDRLSGFQARSTLQSTALARQNPAVRLLPQSLSVPGASADAAPVQLQGLSLQRPDALATVLYFGGNLFHIDDGGDAVLDALAGCPVNVWMFDYRGYGRSGGEPKVETLTADALRLYDHVRDHVRAQQPAGAGPVLVHGYSLGSFMAGQVAQARPVDGLILSGAAPSPRATAEHAVRRRAGLLAPLLKLEISEDLERIDNRQALAAYRGPTLVLAGGRDETTPAELGRAVFEALPAGEHKRWVELPEASHAGLIRQGPAQPAYCELVRQVAGRTGAFTVTSTGAGR